MKTDAEFLKEEAESGSCCVTALIKKGDLIVFNAGDCRAVLSISGAAEALTSDHRSSREDERERIENLSGYIYFCQGLWRLQGILAVSRGIEDSHLKQWVIPDPETRILAIKPEFEFLILACDGLWDKVSFRFNLSHSQPFCTDP
ncbi:probable protein phosphatase 2C 32 [Asparagus officinalis]|uniref:probable protein phosphatase 2C 32 n=1 Tax=Asparagus officinalis TaxID=4686 RepID=UPI00098DEC2F|nr:probable protein phosphatase 2C 32 [Asparagus officinalis]